MKLIWRSFMLVLAASALIAAQDKDKKADKAPSGTTVTKKHVDTEVQPAAKTVKVTPEIIKDAQQKLVDKGYKAGQPTGTMNATTRAAVRKYQQDEKLKVTGKLDENTLSHLNVGAGQTFGAAPGELGRGGKAAGHNIKEGHPVAAAKSIGKGVGRFGKKVGEGTKSGVVGTTQKVAGDHKDSTSSTTPSTTTPK